MSGRKWDKICQMTVKGKTAWTIRLTGWNKRVVQCWNVLNTNIKAKAEQAVVKEACTYTLNRKKLSNLICGSRSMLQ